MLQFDIHSSFNFRIICLCVWHGVNVLPPCGQEETLQYDAVVSIQSVRWQHRWISVRYYKNNTEEDVVGASRKCRSTQSSKRVP